jgi:hypothetical protein
MKRLHLLGAIGVFTLGLGGAAYADEECANDRDSGATYDDGAAVDDVSGDNATTLVSYGYGSGGGQNYGYGGPSYRYAPYNGYGQRPGYHYNYAPVRRPYYGRAWRRPWRWQNGYRVVVPPPARW